MREMILLWTQIENNINDNVVFCLNVFFPVYKDSNPLPDNQTLYQINLDRTKRLLITCC